MHFGAYSMVTGMDGRGIRPSGAAPMAAPPTVYYKACIIVFMLFFGSITRKRPNGLNERTGPTRGRVAPRAVD